MLTYLHSTLNLKEGNPLQYPEHILLDGAIPYPEELSRHKCFGRSSYRLAVAQLSPCLTL